MLSHDVVVVGAGLAGMRAAIAAHEAGVDVALVTKVHPVRSHSGRRPGRRQRRARQRDRGPPRTTTPSTRSRAPTTSATRTRSRSSATSAPGEIIQLEHWGAVFSRDETTGKIAQRPFGGAGYPAHLLRRRHHRAS